MLSENIKNFRKARGLSQDELALRLHVVRQTVSKWERGASVPDSEMLIRISEELGTSVGVLLGESIPQNCGTDLAQIAARLEILNGQYARQTEHRRKLWRGIMIAVLVVCGLVILRQAVELIHLYRTLNEMQGDPAIIGGYDGPTNIYVSNISVPFGTAVAALCAAVAAVVGLLKTRRN